jgi:hypothetical protein
VSITTKALIVSLRISQWTGRKLDKDATETVETEYKTEKQVGNYTKKLLPSAAELKAIERCASGIRQYFAEQTLPWCMDGSRILAAQNYMAFTAQYRILKAEFDAAVSTFIRKYPDLKAQAWSQLGKMFNDDEYPTQSRLETAFSCEVTFMPVPDVGDFRVQILDSEKEAFMQRMREVENDAMRDCWNRLYDVVAKATYKLRDPNAIFRDSLIENIHEVCALLPRLNISDDPKLEEMRIKVEGIVAKMQPDTVRENAHARNEAVDKLSDITSKMSAFMGVIK